jgi:hypothetical protein
MHMTSGKGPEIRRALRRFEVGRSGNIAPVRPLCLLLAVESHAVIAFSHDSDVNRVCGEPGDFGRSAPTPCAACVRVLNPSKELHESVCTLTLLLVGRVGTRDIHLNKDYIVALYGA